MALADIESDLVSEVPWRTCATCHALAGMEPEDQARLRRLLSDRGVKFKEIAAAMEADPETPSVPWESLSRHARNGCSAREQLR